MNPHKFPIKKAKKPNIPLRRKMAVLYSRIMLTIKIAIVLFLYLLFFTKSLDFIKHEIEQVIYEATADIGLSLENVLIEGQYNTTSEDILATLNADTGTPIFAINLPVVKQQLEKNPWVKEALVERRLPSTIYIGLVERVPVAIWQINQKLYLIDDEGYKIISNNIEKFSNLLHIVGKDANIYAKHLLENLERHPEIAAKIISAVRYGERRWNLNLQQNITIKMPEVGFQKAFDYLAELNKAGKLFDQGYKSLDLRDQAKYYLERY